MNVNNNAIKRIMADVRSLAKNPSSRYSAAPLEDNVFEWHFSIRGPAGTDFEGGMYHGRILLPAEYPFKPPNFIFLTKTGRFEVGTKICLSITAYHEESWQPAWGVSSMLEAIISFLPSEGAGSIGALDYSKTERQKLAKESCNYVCPCCGPIAALFPEMTEKERNEMEAEKFTVELKAAAVGAVSSEISSTATAAIGATATAGAAVGATATVGATVGATAVGTVCGVCSDGKTSSITVQNSNFTAAQNSNNNTNGTYSDNMTQNSIDDTAGKEDFELGNDLIVNIFRDKVLSSEMEISSSSSGTINDKTRSGLTLTIVEKNTMQTFLGTAELPTEKFKSAATGVVRKEVFGQGVNKMFLDSDIDSFIAHSVEESILGNVEDSGGCNGEMLNLENSRSAVKKSLPLQNMKIDGGITVGAEEKDNSGGVRELEIEDNILHDTEHSLKGNLRHRFGASSTDDMNNHNFASNEIARANMDSQQVSSSSISENHGNQRENVTLYQPDLLDRFLTFILYVVGTAICFVVFRRFCCLWLFYSKNNLFLGYRNL